MKINLYSLNEVHGTRTQKRQEYILLKDYTEHFYFNIIPHTVQLTVYSNYYKT